MVDRGLYREVMIGPIKGDTGRLDCVYIGMYRGYVGDYRVSGLTTRFLGLRG